MLISLLAPANAPQPTSHSSSRCCFCAAGVWRRSASMAAWAVWRSLMSASPGRSRYPAGVSVRRWSGRWGRRRESCSRTEQPSPAPLSFKPSWDLPPSSRCSSTSASCREGCLWGEVSRAQGLPVGIRQLVVLSRFILTCSVLAVSICF